MRRPFNLVCGAIEACAFTKGSGFRSRTGISETTHWVEGAEGVIRGRAKWRALKSGQACCFISFISPFRRWILFVEMLFLFSDVSPFQDGSNRVATLRAPSRCGAFSLLPSMPSSSLSSLLTPSIFPPSSPPPSLSTPRATSPSFALPYILNFDRNLSLRTAVT